MRFEALEQCDQPGYARSAVPLRRDAGVGDVAAAARETERLAVLEELRILDTSPEADFDDIVLLASEVCGTPVSLVSLVDDHRQWFKARVGIDFAETSRDVAFCTHAIATPQSLFVVPDASADPRFADNPLVTADGGIRFYAGMPIVTDDGHALGTVCVIDRQPRTLTATQERCLKALARQVGAMMKLRRQAIAASFDAQEHANLSAEARLKHEKGSQLLDLVLQGRGLGLWDLDVPSGRWTASASEFGMLGYAATPHEAEDCHWWKLIHPDDRAATIASMEPHLRGEAAYYESAHRMRHREGHWIWVLGRAVVVERCADGRPKRIVGTHQDITEAKQDRLELDRARLLLEDTGRLAKVGGWELDLRTGSLTWTRQVYRIHDVPDHWVPTLAGAIDFYAPEARPRIAAAVEAAIAGGVGYDLQLPVVTACGRAIWVRAYGQVEHEQGVAVRLTGTIQDITDAKLAEQALVDSERRMRLVTDSLPALIAHIDGQQRFTFANAYFDRVFDIAPQSVLGRTIRDVAGDAMHATLEPHIARALDGHAEQFEFVGHARGEPHCYQMHYVPDVGADGKTNGFYAVTFDITATKRAVLKSVETEKLLRGIADNLPVCIAEFDREGRFRFVNETYRRWTGRDPAQMIGRSVHAEGGTAYYESRKDAIARALRGEQLTFECDVVLPVGAERSLHSTYLPHFDEAGRVAGFYALTTDITEQRDTQRKLDALARVDALTALPNRRHFEERAKETLARTRRTRQRGALFYLDVDCFKSINDTFGHASGDELLVQFASRLLEALRESDFVARYAGDEFVAIAEGVMTEADACALAGKVAAAIRVPFVLSSACIHVTTSIGIAMFDGSGALDALLAEADAALYRAKAAGRDRIRHRDHDADARPA